MNPRQVFIATVAIAALSSAGLVAAREAAGVAGAAPGPVPRFVPNWRKRARTAASGRSITYGQPAASALRDEVQTDLAQAKKDGASRSVDHVWPTGVLHQVA
jgi:hypothetical protein